MRLILPLLLFSLTGCGQSDRDFAKQVISDRCAACHSVPGVPGATGRVGPPLDMVGGQQLLGGRLVNNRANMMAWITHAQTIDPGIAMPDIPLSQRQARAVADYLYDLDRDD